jgi:hypothetical protein
MSAARNSLKAELQHEEPRKNTIRHKMGAKIAFFGFFGKSFQAIAGQLVMALFVKTGRARSCQVVPLFL